MGLEILKNTNRLKIKETKRSFQINEFHLHAHSTLLFSKSKKTVNRSAHDDKSI